jgi:hypothetical protein
MAETWRALIQAKAFSITGTAANMAGLLNAGANIIKIRRLGFVNIQTAAATGVMCKGTISRYTGATWTAPTTVTPVPYDSTNAALSSVTCGHTGTAAGSETIISSYVWSSDEPAVAGATIDELETFKLPIDIHGLHVSSFTDHHAERFARLKWGAQHEAGTAYMRFSFDFVGYQQHILRALKLVL